MLQAVKETKTVEKLIYTSSFFALGSTDGYVADESQVYRSIHFSLNFLQFNMMLLACHNIFLKFKTVVTDPS